MNVVKHFYRVANPKASIVLLHGLGEYSGCYANHIETFNKAGISVFTMDWPGHGESEGNRGDLGLDWVDLKKLIKELLDEAGDVESLYLVRRVIV